MEVLCIVAHPDDEVIGLGGTISKHASSGDNVYVLVVSEGVGAQYEDAEKYRKLRQKACLDAAKLLGIKEVVFGDFPDAQLDTVSQLEINKFIEKAIAKFSPDRIYTHHWSDNHKDHRLVYESTLVGARNGTCELCCFEVINSTNKNRKSEDAFFPNFYIDISEDFEKKMNALKFYNTEVKKFPHPISQDALKALAMVRGVEANLGLAEAFVCVRRVEK